MARQFNNLKLMNSEELSLADILSALSFALDLTGGQPMGHAQRTCLIGMRVGREIGLDENTQGTLYHALLMKDAGCSSNSARMYEIFGSDDLSAKRSMKVNDWSNLLLAAKYAVAQTSGEATLLGRARRMLHIAAHKHDAGDGMTQARCDRGAQIALSIGLGPEAAQCIRHLDEHWDGHGSPAHIAGEAIPLLGRIACLAQTLEVFVQTFGVEHAYSVIRERSGRWFDPALVAAAGAFENDAEFWRTLRKSPRQALMDLECRATLDVATESRIDAVCDAFAQIVDVKSHFTAQHSFRVSDYAVQIGQALGFESDRVTTLRRAGLLHDIGKLAVPNTILDKAGKPTDEEWAVIRKHPLYTHQILDRIAGFERLTVVASAHHERLDGSGYFRGVTGEQLDFDMRILAVADVFDALSAERPYRGALPLERVFSILDADAGVALDSQCIDASKTSAAGTTFSRFISPTFLPTLPEQPAFSAPSPALLKGR